MAEHLTEERLELFRRNKLSPAELLSLDDHLAACEECRALIASIPAVSEAAVRLERRLSSDLHGGHVTYSDLETFIDNTAAAEAVERIEAHLALCRECSSEAAQLRQLAADQPNEPDGRAVPGPAWLDVVRGWFSPPKLALAVAVILLALFGISAWMTWDRGASRGGVAIGPTEVNRLANQSVYRDVAQTANSESSEEPSPLPNTGNVTNSTGLERPDAQFGIDLAGLTTFQRQKLERVLRSGDVEIPDYVHDLKAGGGVSMGDSDDSGESFHVRGPSGEVLLTDRPTLHWDALPGATSYTVDVYDMNFNKQASSGPLTDTNWAPRLARGKTYVWQVTAVKDGKEIKAPQRPAPEARFRIVDAESAAAIGQARRRNPDAHLLLGTLYAEAGLLTEALHEFEILEKQNPRMELPRKLTSKVRREINENR